VNKKPEVVFDASNRKHRKAYNDYLRKGNWSFLPFVFKAPHYGITLGYIERTLLQHYSSKEFKIKEELCQENSKLMVRLPIKSPS
jgi:hypothetical protein